MLIFFFFPLIFSLLVLLFVCISLCLWMWLKTGALWVKHHFLFSFLISLLFPLTPSFLSSLQSHSIIFLTINHQNILTISFKSLFFSLSSVPLHFLGFCHLLIHYTPLLVCFGVFWGCFGGVLVLFLPAVPPSPSTGPNDDDDSCFHPHRG